MVLLDGDSFLNELNKLYAKQDKGGSVTVCMKQVGTKKRTRSCATSEGAAQCLVRASAKKRKISTLVPAGDQVRFQLAMATILKAHMLSGLKKKKKQRKKQNRQAD